MTDEHMAEPETPILSVDDLRKTYHVGGSFFGRGRKALRAVDGVSFQIGKGEAVGLVGESGCGKSTIGKLVMRLVPSTSGDILLGREEITKCSERALARHRRTAQIIFQDPYGSLDPRMTVGDYIAEPMVVHNIGTRAERAERVLELLKSTGLGGDHAGKYPHEFSGGQRQRVAIARALSLSPKLVIADEPVSALDLSVQASVLNLMKDLQNELGLSYLFISHDISVVRFMCDRILVMYLGRIVEQADSNTIFSNPRHPYTVSLLDSVPVPDPRRRSRKRQLLTGDIASPLAPPSGCRFRTRCPRAQGICAEVDPKLQQTKTGGYVACHNPVSDD
ncbi:ABC transporter ATP-binding protein [Hoeflea prorocentri]|uniref:ATP-binding cassette domain-containing protein n=1 Tax=Hoeflea prorocentri TaxID=1922333 RepID=A0A9X3ZIE0_9HYPH|nr:oligopeptide/dipeptide ABC transporter ATP-binding protein [Hoeflea prorocentri]MCY6381913.1 ATP-binding cassette domain-containing protein [Hoeflea prorocentri]MDA5399713.1 ATP-binding cassette domain-containing protein [Hoeflea prorocentri]